MERNTYLQKILQCAKPKETGLPGMKKFVPEQLQVTYKGIEYYPYGYAMYANPDGTWMHTAVLHDIKANAVVSAVIDWMARHAVVGALLCAIGFAVWFFGDVCDAQARKEG